VPRPGLRLEGVIVSDEPLGDLLADRRVRLTWQAANHGYPEAMLRDGSSVAGRTAWLPVLESGAIADLDALGSAIATRALAQQGPRATEKETLR
jgi:hypothetical protein